MSPRIPLILGAGQIGLPSSAGARVTNASLVQDFVDLMVSHGHVSIDTSRRYCDGTSEKVLGGIDLRGVARVDTKVFPAQPGGHKPEKVKESFDVSMAALQGKKIQVLYLHKPDRTVPFEETLEAMNDLHKAGKFEELGLSNYASWEVAEIVGICKRRGFVLPTVYEGVYNLLDRTNEAELFPCLRKFGIKFAAYAILAGGYLTDRFFDVSKDGGSTLQHFDPKYASSWFYTSRYYPMASAVAKFGEVLKAHDLSLTEVSYRWLQWHSQLQPGDHGIIVASTKKEQLENTIKENEKSQLPDEVVQACEDLWCEVKGVATKYWAD